MSHINLKRQGYKDNEKISSQDSTKNLKNIRNDSLSLNKPRPVSNKKILSNHYTKYTVASIILYILGILTLGLLMYFL
ncbi:hypothetical protein HZS_3085 [Henneguya salminicola]|nr:hypothetical protein HZS_3085 [Henneguya salminicola]